MRHRGWPARPDRGQGTLEYIAMIIAAALVAVAVIIGANSAGFGTTFADNVCKVLQTDCGTAAPGGGEENEHTPFQAGGMGAEGEDPGANVQYPPGLDPNSDIAKELASTERGRRILQWLHDNGIEVIVDPNAQGAWYSGGKIVLGKGYVDPSTIIHEANHAYYDKNGKNPNVTTDSRETYVNSLVDQETESVWLEVQAAKEYRANNPNVKVSQAEENYDSAYQNAYQQARANGASHAEAQTAGDNAGRARIRQMFTNGEVVTSTTGQTYEEYYGSFWDTHH